jgi:hypothetical protein
MANGGFPKPTPGSALRVVEARHLACGATTRVMIPSVLPARAVRRVSCHGCGERFETADAREVRPFGLPGIARLRESVSLPRLDPSSRAWRIASVPIAAALVIAGIALIQGDDGVERTRTPAALAPAPAETAEAGEASRPLSEVPGERTGGNGGGKAVAEVVRGANYSLALPTGWEKVDPPAGATFSAVVGGEAEVTLWISEDPSLGFPDFITQSLRQLETLAPNPRVAVRIPGPTPETTVVRLAADVPASQPSYEVLLRAAGPYRYYLALTTYPEAGPEAADGVELIANSLTPEVKG